MSKKTKYILGLLLIALLSFTVTGCNGKFPFSKKDIETDIEQVTDTHIEETERITETEEETIPETESETEEKIVSAQMDSSDFVVLSEAIPDVILEIRYYSTYNFVGERIDGYEEPIALITKEAADALKQVSDYVMENGYRLKIYDAYRPQCAVDHFVRWAKDASATSMKAYFYPEKDKSVLFSEGYISAHSGHSRGSTVDLTLVDMNTGKEVDMGGTFDYFGQRSHPDYKGITTEQYNNRMFLRNAMTRFGFKSINTEWWHFTLANEPYTNTYFEFSVNSSSVKSDSIDK